MSPRSPGPRSSDARRPALRPTRLPRASGRPRPRQRLRRRLDVWVRAEGDEIKANDTAALELTGSTRPRLEFGLNETPGRLTVSYAGARRTWELPPTWSMNKGWALSYGSVVSIASTEDQRTLAVQLFADGAALGGTPLGESYSYDGTPTVDDDGIVQLEQVGDTLEVVRYPLPAATT